MPRHHIEDFRESPIQLSIFRRLYSYTSEFKGTLIASLVLAIVQVSAFNTIPLLIKVTIDNYIIPQPINFPMIGLMALVMIAATLVGGICLNLKIKKTILFEQQAINKLRQMIFSHLQELSMSFYDKTKEGRIIARADSDLTAIEDILAWGAMAFVQNALNFIQILVIMAILDIYLFLLILVLIVPMVILTFLFKSKAQKAYRIVRRRIARITSNLAENINGVRVVQAFNRQKYNLKQFDTLNRQSYEANIKAARIYLVFMSIMEVVGICGIALILSYGGYSVIVGRLALGVLIAYMLYAVNLFAPIRAMADVYNGALSAMAASERIFNLLDTKPDITDPAEPVHLERIEGKVAFDNVTFSYDGNEPVLSGVSFDVAPGESIALVGPTNAGKTTIVSLVARFYKPQHGAILIDGVDIARVTQQNLRSQYGLVPQDSFLFSGTVMDNIRYGKLNATDDEIIAVAQRLGSHERIMNLENGYHTEVAEGGTSLSQGERQLICFTRALIAQPRILILDEATANVDVHTETVLQEALPKLIAGRTSFIIAHRLSTIRRVDRIFVILDGKLVETGSHHELIAKNGHYARMYREFIREGMGSDVIHEENA